MLGLSQRKKQLIRTFHFEAKRLLSESERRSLFHILKEFQRYRQIDKLVFELRELLHSPEKLDLLRHIRDLIPRAHVNEFDGYFRQSASRQALSPTVQRRRQNGRHSPEIIIRPNVHERVFDAMRRGEVVVVTIQKVSPESNLGFSVRGGAEHGLGVYVSEIEEGSLADLAGLELGDKLLEVNNISVEEVTSSGAVKVLTGSNKLKLLVERTGQLPEWRLSREKVTWYNSHTRLLMEGEYEDGGGTGYIRGLDADFPERRLTLSISDRHKELGFNIRGGVEYGIGIYISKVDKGSIAERHGVRVGDQILEVNGISFSNISHPNAVDVLRSETHLILTLRDMGRYPAYKELFAEYSWNSQTNTLSSSRSGTSRVRQTKLRDMALDKGSQRSRALHLRVPIPSGIYSNDQESTELPLQSEIYLPHVQRNDISKSNSWTYGPIQIENWSGARGSKVTGSVNPAYLPNESGSDTISISSDATDDSSGVRGEYDITMDDIIARGDDLDNVTLDRGDNQKMSGSVELMDLNPQYMESISDLDLSDNNDSDENNDLAVVFLGRANHTSETSSVRSDDNTPKQIEYKYENSEVTAVKQELSPLQNSDDIDCTFPTQQRVASEKVTNKYHLSTVDNAPQDSIVIHMESPSSYLPINDAVHGDDSGEATNDDEGVSGDASIRFDTEEDIQEKTFIDPYQVNMELEDDEDLMCVMQNFDDQIRDLEQRQSNIGFIEMSTLSSQDQPGKSCPDTLDVPGRKEDSIISGKWKAIKEKLKGSIRLTRESLDPRGEYYGSMKLHKNSINKNNMTVLRDEFRKLLNADEYSAAVRHVETYHSSRDLDRMIQTIIPILDKPEKLLLLRDIRGVLYSNDLSRFDQRVHRIEMEAYEKLSTKLHLQLNHVNKGRKPKKHLLMTETDSRSAPEPVNHTKDESGHFYIKPVEQHDQEQRIKQHVVDVMSGRSHGSQHSSPPESVGDACSVSGREPDFTCGEEVTTLIQKDRPTLGLCVSGGSNSKKQPEVRVDTVLETGAAANSSLIQPGMTLVSVDGHSLVGVSHTEAVRLLKMAFNDRSKSAMEIKLHPNK
ncbi:PDZ domain-containing protein 7-like isoform X2 [Argopecten irradians]|uniref:PDZ domain-containing protein 7-like isoform X2 n=1 Tax=Argopecten irradians TaxID=31199 RepID=UPI00371644AF